MDETNNSEDIRTINFNVLSSEFDLIVRAKGPRTFREWAVEKAQQTTVIDHELVCGDTVIN